MENKSKKYVSIKEFQEKLKPYHIKVIQNDSFVVDAELMNYYLKMAENLQKIADSDNEAMDDLEKGFMFNGEFVKDKPEDIPVLEISTETLNPEDKESELEAFLISFGAFRKNRYIDSDNETVREVAKLLSFVYANSNDVIDMDELADFLNHCSEFYGESIKDGDGAIRIGFKIPNLFIRKSETEGC